MTSTYFHKSTHSQTSDVIIGYLEGTNSYPADDISFQAQHSQKIQLDQWQPVSIADIDQSEARFVNKRHLPGSAWTEINAQTPPVVERVKRYETAGTSDVFAAIGC